MPEVTVDLMRHERSRGNDEERYQGASGKFPLAEIGIRRTELKAKHLVEENRIYRAIYASELERAYGTAEIIASVQPRKPRVRRESCFNELHLGDSVAGMKVKDIPQKFPFEWSGWLKNPMKTIPHFSGGQIVTVEADRAFLRLIQIVSLWEDGDRILVVSHEAKIRLVLLKILNRLQDYHFLVPPQNGEIITLTFTEKLPHPVHKQKLYKVDVKGEIQFLKSPVESI